MALHDEDERQELTYEEARTMLDAQRETVSEVNTKAMRTVRITVVLIGALLSAWRIDTELFEPTFATAGGLALLGALAAGIVAYTESDIYLGPSGEYVERLANGDFHGDDWKHDLLCDFGTWIASNERKIVLYSRVLAAAQVLLLVGVGLFGLSVHL